MPNEVALEHVVTDHNDPHEQILNVVVLGTGNIGQQFIKLIRDKTVSNRLKGQYQLVALANSRHYYFEPKGLAIPELELDRVAAHDNSQGQIYERLNALIGLRAVIIDLTASGQVAEQYLRFAQNGWHMISANKVAAANHEYADSIDSALNVRQAKWLQNTTVGAALPIQDTIRRINRSGDQVHQVSGVFSGSVSWLFGQFDGTKSFMDLIKKAHQSALTEPNPRDDLSGQDVYRKAKILARVCGFKPQKTEFNPVLPEPLLAGSLQDFWQRELVVNEYIDTKIKGAQAGHKLQYLVQVNAKKINIGLVVVDQSHATASLKPGDNIFIVESNWYQKNPLIIQGPGAGKEVTAAGVLDDLNQLLRA